MKFKVMITLFLVVTSIVSVTADGSPEKISLPISTTNPTPLASGISDCALGTECSSCVMKSGCYWVMENNFQYYCNTQAQFDESMSHLAGDQYIAYSSVHPHEQCEALVQHKWKIIYGMIACALVLCTVAIFIPICCFHANSEFHANLVGHDPEHVEDLDARLRARLHTISPALPSDTLHVAASPAETQTDSDAFYTPASPTKNEAIEVVAGTTKSTPEEADKKLEPAAAQLSESDSEEVKAPTDIKSQGIEEKVNPTAEVPNDSQAKEATQNQSATAPSGT